MSESNINVTSTIKNQPGFTTEIKIRDHVIIADEPKEVQGNDQGPRPGELLLSSLGACTVITLKMYLARKEWDFNDIHTELEMDKKERKIFMKISVSGSLNEEQKGRILTIAHKCPVHKMLEDSFTIEASLA